MEDKENMPNYSKLYLLKGFERVKLDHFLSLDYIVVNCSYHIWSNAG
jgi:hypothetical protein